MTLFPYRKSLLNLSLAAIAGVLLSAVGLVKANYLEEDCISFGGVCALVCHFDDGTAIGDIHYDWISSICGVEWEEEDGVNTEPATADAVICSTRTSRMEVTNRHTVVIYGTGEGGTKGTLFIAEIPLSSIRNITEEERASGEKIWIMSYDSTIVEGWHIDIYWQNERYGAHITGNGGAFVDDTGANCGL